MPGPQSKAKAALVLALLLLGGLLWWYLRPTASPPVAERAVAGANPASASLPTPVVAPMAVSPEPKLAICLDDWGYSAVAVRRLKTGLKFPLTTAILPNLPYSVAAADASFAAGHEVILHCPVQSVKAVRREKGTLMVGMSAQEAYNLVAGHWAAVPHLVGMNNHEGSAGTADRTLMDGAAAFLKGKGAYFLDSVTTPHSVIPEAAKAAGIRWARRRVFLDDVNSVAGVTAQLKLAVALARKNGHCIAIGHPREATLDVLEKMLPRIQAEGIELVKVSALVHY